MESIKEKILEKIKNKEIAKKPRWFFAIKNSIFWMFWAASVVIGSISFAVIIFLIDDYDWDIYPQLNTSLEEHVLKSLPYIWIVLLGICVWLAYREFKNTKSGYRFMPYFIIGGSVCVSIVLGSAAYAFGIGEWMDEFTSKVIPPYRTVMRTKFDIWRRPDIGLIAGRIGNQIDDDVFEFVDLQQNRWRIDITDALWRAPVPLMPGMQVRIIGELGAPGMFRVNEIRPWRKMNPMEGAKEFIPVPRNR